MAHAVMQARRDDARRKISLGGLVIKAGLGDESAEVLLGALLAVARALKGDQATSYRARYERDGRKAFGL